MADGTKRKITAGTGTTRDGNIRDIRDVVKNKKSKRNSTDVYGNELPKRRSSAVGNDLLLLYTMYVIKHHTVRGKSMTYKQIAELMREDFNGIDNPDEACDERDLGKYKKAVERSIALILNPQKGLKINDAAEESIEDAYDEYEGFLKEMIRMLMGGTVKIEIPKAVKQYYFVSDIDYRDVDLVREYINSSISPFSDKEKVYLKRCCDLVAPMVAKKDDFTSVWDYFWSKDEKDDKGNRSKLPDGFLSHYHRLFDTVRQNEMLSGRTGENNPEKLGISYRKEDSNVVTDVSIAPESIEWRPNGLHVIGRDYSNGTDGCRTISIKMKDIKKV